MEAGQGRTGLAAWRKGSGQASVFQRGSVEGSQLRRAVGEQLLRRLVSWLASSLVGEDDSEFNFSSSIGKRKHGSRVTHKQLSPRHLLLAVDLLPWSGCGQALQSPAAAAAAAGWGGVESS